jgi:hypothetical protein
MYGGMIHRRFLTIASLLSVAFLVMCYFLSQALAADMKIPPKENPAVRAWICGYSAGFEDGIRKLDDPRQPESPQCEKYKAQAKSGAR